nr:hypothetical protein [Chenggangzhangella methanolivorans]
MGEAVNEQAAPFLPIASAQASISAAVVKGEVHCRKTSTSTGSPSASIMSRAWSSALSDEAWSPEISAGRSTTSAPAARAAAAISGSSVET